MIVEKLEIKLYDDGTGNLNFWDFAHGNDVVVDITTDGKLMAHDLIDDPDSDEEFATKKVNEREISFQEYIKLVKESVEKRTI